MAGRWDDSGLIGRERFLKCVLDHGVESKSLSPAHLAVFCPLFDNLSDEHYLTIRRNIKEINPRGRRRIAEEFARHESCRFSKGDQKHIFELLKDIAGDNGKSFWMNNLRALVEFRASLPKENESKSFTTNSPETSAHHNWDAFDYNSPVELQEAIAREDQNCGWPEEGRHQLVLKRSRGTSSRR